MSQHKNPFLGYVIAVILDQLNSSQSVVKIIKYSYSQNFEHFHQIPDIKCFRSPQVFIEMLQMFLGINPVRV